MKNKGVTKERGKKHLSVKITPEMYRNLIKISVTYHIKTSLVVRCSLRESLQEVKKMDTEALFKIPANFPAPGKKYKHISVKVEKEMRDSLLSACEKYGLKLSELVRRLITLSIIRTKENGSFFIKAVG